MFSSLEQAKTYMVSVLDNKKRWMVCLMIFIAVSSFAYAVADADKDGIPDSEDSCSGSETTVVDIIGCSCSQKLAAGGIWSCSDDGNECTKTCGELGGKAYCNLWDYTICPNDQITTNQNAAASQCIGYNQNTENELCCTGYELKTDLNKSKTEMTCCNPSECAKEGECKGENTLAGKMKCIDGEWVDITVQTQTAMPQEDNAAVGQGYDIVQDDIPELPGSKTTGAKTGKAIGTVIEDSITKDEKFNWWYIILIIMVCIGIATFVYSENSKKKDIEQIVAYLQENLKKGYPAIALKQKLQQEGWGAEIIEKAFNMVLENK